MINDDDIENLLLNVPRVHVRAGRHHFDLKAKLLQTPYHESSIMKTRKSKWVVAACCAVLLLSVVGFAAQQVYLKCFIVEQTKGETTILPDGSAFCSGSTVCTVTNDPHATQETANQHWREIKKAIENGRYQLKETKNSDEGITVFDYLVTLEDGTQVHFGSNRPLQETNEQRQQMLKQAVENGCYQLKETKEINGHTLYCYIVTLADGTQVGYGLNKPLPEPEPQKTDR